MRLRQGALLSSLSVASRSRWPLGASGSHTVPGPFGLFPHLKMAVSASPCRFSEGEMGVCFPEGALVLTPRAHWFRRPVFYPLRLAVRRFETGFRTAGLALILTLTLRPCDCPHWPV